MRNPIAIAIYTRGDDDLYTVELFTEEEVQKVRDSENEQTADWKTIIVYGNNLKVEYHT